MSKKTVIYVDKNYAEQEGDIVLHSFGESTKLLVSDVSFYKKWIIKNRDKEFKQLEKVKLNIDISLYIYDKYPLEKQHQDTVSFNFYSTLLREEGKEDVKNIIVEVSKYFSDKKNVYDFSKDTAFSKILKIAIKVQWCRLVIDEYKKAYSLHRDVEQIDYPIFSIADRE